MASVHRLRRSARRFGTGSAAAFLAATAAVAFAFVGGVGEPILAVSGGNPLDAEVGDALSVVLNDLREAAPADAESSGPVAVETNPGMHRIRFLADVDADGLPERVTYSVSRGYLLRTVQRSTPAGWSAEIPVAVLGGVTAFELQLLDHERNVLAGEAGRERPPRFARLFLGARARGSESRQASETVLSGRPS